MGKRIDWAYVQENLQDIKESTEALNNWDKKDMSEYHFHDIVITMALQNIKYEMGIE